VTTQAQILRLLRNLQREHNAAIIFITHDLGVIAQMAHYVTVMYLGLVVEQGPVDALFHNPRHPYTRALLESIPSIDAMPRANLPTITGSIPHPFNRPTGCPFYPRCSRFMPGVCDQRQPQLVEVDEGERVSCFLYEGSAVPAARSSEKEATA
jgi:peptide/nickel transport system ATP-binding protein